MVVPGILVSIIGADALGSYGDREKPPQAHTVSRQTGRTIMIQPTHARASGAVAFAAVLIAVGFVPTSGARELIPNVFVANNGVDSATCGAETAPCRSVTRGIARAAEGDTIMVGPGRYGDLNGNGIFGETGEEHGEPGFGCFCMIQVNKRVTLVSRTGAFTTVLDAGGTQMLPVRITASGVVLGLAQHGFWLTGASNGGNGLGCCGGASGVSVIGNIASENDGTGFAITGAGSVIRLNLAARNGNGFGILGDSRVTVKDNVAVANVRVGFYITGNGHFLRGNESHANAFGVLIAGTAINLLQNSVIGNKLFGFWLELGSSATISENNIYGNGNDPTAGIANCGIYNQSDAVIVATGNFWGSASGPGADPADRAGTGTDCDYGAGTMTTVVPFATLEFPIKVTALK
jgi:hypothetical protein